MTENQERIERIERIIKELRTSNNIARSTATSLDMNPQKWSLLQSACDVTEALLDRLEVLMTLPIGWTERKPTDMVGFRKWLRLHGKS